MTSIKGRSVFGSIARGKLTFYHRDEFIINKIKVSDPELEYKKYVKAKNAALVELGELYDRARLSVGEGDAQIFVIHDKCGSCNYGNILCSGICIFKACRQI